MVANPPFSYRWNPNEALGEDVAFQELWAGAEVGSGLSRFCCMDFSYLKDDGAMAIILPHGVLFRGGARSEDPPQAP